MEEAIAAAKPIDAYAAHTKLLREHPELATEASLADAVKKTTAAEQAAINICQRSKNPLKPLNAPHRGSPRSPSRIVASRHGTQALPARPAFASMAPSTASTPPPADSCGGATSATNRRLADSNRSRCPYLRHRPARIAATRSRSGKAHLAAIIRRSFRRSAHRRRPRLRASDSGRLYVLDLKSGARTGFLQCPQPLHVAPAIDRTKTRLYLAADRASVYSFTLPDLKCSGVYFLGHAPGSHSSAAVVVMDKFAVVENNGVETSHLHLLAADYERRAREGTGETPP